MLYGFVREWGGGRGSIFKSEKGSAETAAPPFQLISVTLPCLQPIIAPFTSNYLKVATKCLFPQKFPICASEQFLQGVFFKCPAQILVLKR